MRQTSIATRLVSLLAALIIAMAASPAAAELVAGAGASQAAHAAKKKAAHKKKAHKKKAHKKKTHKKKTHKKKTQKPPKKETPPAASLAELEKGGTKAIESASEIPLAPAFTKAELTAQPKGNWISSQGGGATGDHYSQLTEITPANVASLKSTWMTQLDGSGIGSKYSGEADMTVYKGVGYYPTGADDIFAVSIASGKILWVHKGELPETVADVCCGWDNRGVAIGDGLVYSAILTGSIEALNQQTGQLVWKTELGEPAEGFTATSQPLYYEGMVFIGPVGSEYGVRGFMEAFNAKTGALLWKHYNIPAPGEFGHETWPTAAEGPTRAATCKECDQEWQHGGATTWNAPTVSAATGDIYYSTANAGGLGTNGGDSGGDTRGGEDLWTVSMLALNYKTGEQVWGYQEVHHDIWDYDQSVAPIMINAEVNGKKIEGIATGNKDGYIYYVNSETGQPVFEAPEKAIPQDVPLEATFPTQPIPVIPPAEEMHPTAEELTAFQEKACSEAAATTAAHKPFACPKVVQGGYEGLNVFAPYNEVGSSTVELSSGGSSGIRTNNEAYDPEKGLLITCSRGGQWSGKQLESQAQLPQGETYGVGKSGLTASVPTTVSAARHGYLSATSMDTGKQVWMVPTEEPCYTGATVTKGGVLFLGEEEGRISAYETATGKKLWSFEIGAPPGMVAVYEQEGKEDMEIYAGGNDLEGGGKAHADDLWQFSLSGSGAQGPIALGATPPPKETLGANGE